MRSEKEFIDERDVYYLKFKNDNHWWHAVNWYNCNIKLRKEKISDTRLVYFPNYAANPYQKLMYQKLEHSVKPKSFDIFEDLLFLSSGRKKVFHIHWLKEIFSNCNTELLAIDCYTKFIDEIKIYKNIGCKIVWTVHNKIDHDQPEFIKRYLIKVMQYLANNSDIIHVHTLNTIEIMETFLNVSIRHKAEHIEHPLYPIPNDSEIKSPPELDGKSFNEYFLSLGMIRPYKGVELLLRAFDKCMAENIDIKLIVAGYSLDPKVDEIAKTLEYKYPNNIIFINRKLKEEEVNYLYKNCLSSVLTYKKILISGSYYMAATHSKPSICPNIGMFKEKVKDNENGFIYDQSLDDLAETLRKINSLDKDIIKSVGEKSHSSCVNTHEEFSCKYFNLVR